MKIEHRPPRRGGGRRRPDQGGAGAGAPRDPADPPLRSGRTRRSTSTTGPFCVNAALRDWEVGGRRAAPASAPSASAAPTPTWCWRRRRRPRWRRTTRGRRRAAAPLGAQRRRALEAAADRLGRHLERHPSSPLGRRGLHPPPGPPGHGAPPRRGLPRPRGRRWRPSAADAGRTATPPAGGRAVVFLFPGQGAQHAGMAAGLYERGAGLPRGDRPLRRDPAAPLGGRPAGVLLATEPASSTATDGWPSRRSSPSSTPWRRLWMAWGVTPAADARPQPGRVRGGRRSPASSRSRTPCGWWSGGGRLMQSTAEGAMLAVPLPEAEIGAAARRRGRAGGRQRAGPLASSPALPRRSSALRLALAAQGIDARPLAVRRAFHSRSLEPILDAFVDEVRRARPRAPEIPWLSNLTGGWMSAEAGDRPGVLGARRCGGRCASRRPWPSCCAIPGGCCWRSARGGRSPALVRRHGGEAVSSLPHPEARLRRARGCSAALGELWLAGVEVDWNGLGGGGTAGGALPTYPFERRRYWVDAPAGRRDGSRRPVALSSRRRSGGRSSPRADATCERRARSGWPSSRTARRARQLVQGLRGERLEPVVAVPGPTFARLSAGAFTVDPGQHRGFRGPAGRGRAKRASRCGSCFRRARAYPTSPRRCAGHLRRRSSTFSSPAHVEPLGGASRSRAGGAAGDLRGPETSPGGCSTREQGNPAPPAPNVETPRGASPRRRFRCPSTGCRAVSPLSPPRRRPTGRLYIRRKSPPSSSLER